MKGKQKTASGNMCLKDRNNQGKKRFFKKHFLIKN